MQMVPLSAFARRPLAAALAFLLSALALVLLRPLLAVDETRYLTVAWEMWTGGSKIVPHLNAEVYSHKPPLLFWLVDLVWLLVGPSDLAARMVAPLAGAGAVLLCGHLALALWPEAPARAGRAAWALAGSGVWLAYGSATMFDTLLTLATLGAMLALWALAQDAGPSRRTVAGLGAALALGVLAKGPVILLHVLPAALAYPLWRPGVESRAPRLFYAALGLAILVALGLLALWLGPALVLGDAAYRNDILWRQSAGRMVQSFAHDRPVWFLLALLPLFLWPFGWGRQAACLWRGAARPQVRYLLIWALAGLVAFSFVSGKQIHYLMPELAALALLLSQAEPAPPEGLTRFVPLAPALLLLLGGIAALLGLVPEKTLPGGVAPLGLLAAVALFALALALVGRAQSLLGALAPVAPVTLIIVELLAWRSLWQESDPGRIAALLSEGADRGVATPEPDYAGQFSYAAHLPAPVTVLRRPEALVPWLQAHPGGLLLTTDPLDQPGLVAVGDAPLQREHWWVYRVAPPAS
jgi:4-amino-4-deoxy-L-arabinose transferase-like glycosyltransferase